MRTIISSIVLAAFVSTSIQMPVYAQIDPLPWMPKPGVMVPLSPEFTPAYLKGIVIHPENALKFDFIIDRGDKPLSDAQKKEEYTKLTKYFLASLAIPDDDQWVNLSPYEKDRIIKEDFGKTEMGRDLLAQDYLLKQITASLIYPQSSLGRKFWNKVYAQAQKQYGTTNIPVNTFNKVWILPDDALIYEKGNTAYVLKNHLRVMLEEDYLSLQKHSGISTVIPAQAGIQSNDTHTIASQIIKQIVLPELQREVNEDTNFAPLRQVYSGMLLAAWFKKELKASLLGQIYANKARVKGVDQDPKTNEAIYGQYLKAYKKGVFNFIQEDSDSLTSERIPRKYFSGGTTDYAMASEELGHNVIQMTRDPAQDSIAKLGLSTADLATVAMQEKTSQKPDAAMSSQVDVYHEFRQVSGLGADVPVAFVVKFDQSGSIVTGAPPVNADHLLPRWASPHRPNEAEFLKDKLGQGHVLVGLMKAGVPELIGNPVFRHEMHSPYAYTTDNKRILIGGLNRIEVFTRSTGQLERTIILPSRLQHIHSLEFLSTNHDIVLVAATGSDRIAEININTGKIVWEWNPWNNGYSRNWLKLSLVEEGDDLPSGREFSFEEAERLMLLNRILKDDDLFQVVNNMDNLDPAVHPIGLRAWQKVTAPNWAAYSPNNSNEILATFFNHGQAVRINRNTGQATVVLNDLDKGHGFVPFKDGQGFLVSNTRDGQVILLDQHFNVSTIFDFRGFPLPSGTKDSGFEWIQNTFPITPDLLATVDSRRNQVYVWDMGKKVYSIYPFNPDYRVHSVQPAGNMVDAAMAIERPNNFLVSTQNVLEVVHAMQHISDGDSDIFFVRPKPEFHNRRKLSHAYFVEGRPHEESNFSIPLLKIELSRIAEAKDAPLFFVSRRGGDINISLFDYKKLIRWMDGGDMLTIDSLHGEGNANTDYVLHLQMTDEESLLSQPVKWTLSKTAKEMTNVYYGTMYVPSNVPAAEFDRKKFFEDIIGAFRGKIEVKEHPYLEDLKRKLAVVLDVDLSQYWPPVYEQAIKLFAGDEGYAKRLPDEMAEQVSAWAQQLSPGTHLRGQDGNELILGRQLLTRKGYHILAERLAYIGKGNQRQWEPSAKALRILATAQIISRLDAATAADAAQIAGALQKEDIAANTTNSSALMFREPKVSKKRVLQILGFLKIAEKKNMDPGITGYLYAVAMGQHPSFYSPNHGAAAALQLLRTGGFFPLGDLHHLDPDVAVVVRALFPKARPASASNGAANDAAMAVRMREESLATHKDKAQASDLGGIDMNSANLNLQIKRDGNGVPLPISQQDMAQLSRIQGLEPVILSIKPASQTALFAGPLNHN